MIGIVIVSHSARLAEGLKEMAEAMTQAPVPVVAAGGMPDGDLGTDAVRVMAAIEAARAPGGVAVFADIGSAKLSADLAIEMLDGAGEVRLAEAPFVEGVLAAAVQSAAGGDLDAVLAEASGGLAVDDMADGVGRDFRIRNRLGLHARPAALFVQQMAAFQGRIQIANLSKGKPPANAKSINGVMLSEVTFGDTVRLIAAPDEAEAVFAAMDRMLANGFGEGVWDDTEPSAPAAVDRLSGQGIAPGLGVGPLHHVRRDLPEVPVETVGDPAAELDRLDAAIAQARAEIDALVTEGGDAGAIFEAHRVILDDPDLRRRVGDAVRKRQVCAAAVWRDEVNALRRDYAALNDPLLAARSADVMDVGRRVLRHLGVHMDDAFPEGAVLAFDELHPSDVPALTGAKVAGLCSMAGGKASHAGILATSLPLPVVFGLGDALAAVPEGTQVLLDGAGRLRVDPSAADLAAIEVAEAERRDLMQRAEAVRHGPAMTADGQAVRVAANMGALAELDAVADSGAEEVGLLRTEFLFMKRDTAPSEADQTDVYSQIVQALNGRPLTVRTMDIGGDKPVAYLDRPPEANPNLGWRGLRHGLDRPDLLGAQLAAILRAGAKGPVRVMFPLVASLDELRAAKALLAEVRARLAAEGVAHDPDVPVGIMVEVPAAVEKAELFAREVDFFSVGTNDLTQYVMAADRANPKVQGLFDPFDPAVLCMVRRTIEAGQGAGIWTGMCGAMAGDPLATPVLLGLGLDEFSMPPAAVGRFKLGLQGLTIPACRDLAAEVIGLATACEVRERIAAFLG